MDFNGLAHYYLRQGRSRVGDTDQSGGQKNRGLQSHAIGLRMRNDLQKLPTGTGRMKLVETPGPPVIASIVAEVYGQPDIRYEDLLLAADTVRARLAVEPGVVDIDDGREAAQEKLTFVTDTEKAALSGVSADQIASTLQAVLGGATVGLVRNDTERNPLRIQLRVPVDNGPVPPTWPVRVKGDKGQLVPLAELGRWETTSVDQMIYHKNLQRVAYVFAETAGRPPADVVVDVCRMRPTTSRRPRTPNTLATDGWLTSPPGLSQIELIERWRSGAGRCRRDSRWILPARESGESRSTYSAISGWPLVRQ